MHLAFEGFFNVVAKIERLRFVWHPNWYKEYIPIVGYFRIGKCFYRSFGNSRTKFSTLFFYYIRIGRFEIRWWLFPVNLSARSAKYLFWKERLWIYAKKHRILRYQRNVEWWVRKLFSRRGKKHCVFPSILESDGDFDPFPYFMWGKSCLDLREKYAQRIEKINVQAKGKKVPGDLTFSIPDTVSKEYAGNYWVPDTSRLVPLHAKALESFRQEALARFKERKERAK